MKASRALITCVITIVSVVIATASPSHAQLLGQVSTARTLVRGANDMGGYIGLFEDYTTLFGQYRRGLSSNMDFGLQAGLIDPDIRGADAGLILGGDLKFNVMSAGYDPFDMALGVRGSFFDISNMSVLSVGGAVILSRDYSIEGGGILSPYGSVNIRLEHASFDNNGGFDNNDTDLEIGGTAGAKWELSDLIDALGEIVLDENWGLVVGLNFKL
ncbi:MAG: hypothetical protein Kow0074_11330 [Candidatus Zixiibacteriota bacterium]